MPAVLAILIATWQFVVKRSFAQWKLLSAVVLGVVLASAIMSGTVVYFDALRELSLKHALEQHSQSELNIVIAGQRGPSNRDEYNRVAKVIHDEIQTNVEWMLTDKTFAGKSPTFFLTQPGQENTAGNDNARTYFAFASKLSEQITILPGGEAAQWSSFDPASASPIIEAIVPYDRAETFGIQVGDTLSAVPPWSERWEYVSVVVTGIFKPRDKNSEFWHLEKSLNAATGPSFRTLPFFISENAYFDELGENLLRMDTTYIWLLEVDTQRVNAQNSATVISGVRELEANLDLAMNVYRQETLLPAVLSEYEERLFFSKLPMFVVLILIAIVILYYVVTLSSLAVEERRGEIALLRSRGASSAQILLVFILEGLSIASLSVIVGPLLAVSAVTTLGFTPIFSEFSDGSLVATVSSEAVSMAGLGGLLSFLALIFPAIQASRVGVSQQRQQAARPPDQPAFHRYYIDVLLVLIAILLFRQLTEQGSVVATQVFGKLVVDHLLLVLPAIILVASAMIILRLFPLAMSMISRLFSAWLPAGLVLGIWQMARNPTHYARLSLLLILTAGLGIFASSFSSTLERSFDERVLLETGSDIRLLEFQPAKGRNPISSARSGYWRRRPTPIPTPVIGQPIKAAFEKVSGITQASPFLRASGRDMSTSFSQGFDMLALERESFLEVSWVRDDFTDASFSDALAKLNNMQAANGLTIPKDARSIGIRVRPDRAHPDTRLTVRIKTARDRYYTYPLGFLESRHWIELETDLQTGTLLSSELDFPLKLVSIRIDHSISESTLESGTILIDEIWSSDVTGAKTTLDNFIDITRWPTLKVTASASSDVLSMTSVGFESATSAALFAWSQGPALVARGIYYGDKIASIPVLASKTFLTEMGHRINDEFEISVSGNLIPIKVVGALNLFPTITTPSTRFLVGDIDSVIQYANLGSSYLELHPNEIWLSSLTEGTDRKDLIETLQQVEGHSFSDLQDRGVLQGESKIDPLVEAGWKALLFIAFSAVLVLSCTGFLVHAYVSFQNRRLQFALLRTVGFSFRQLTAMIWLEQALIVGLGLTLGSWMGGRLGATIMPYLGHNDFGGQVMPPFVVEVDWTALFMTYILMISLFALITMSLIFFVSRISLQKILRLGEV